MFTQTGRRVNDGEGSASMEAKLIPWEAGEAAAITARPTRRTAWCISNDCKNELNEE